MRLVNEHGLSIPDLLVIVIIVKSGSSRATANNRAVRLHPATLELLLTICLEDTFKVALSHTVANLSEYLNMALYSYLGSPAHYLDLLRGLGHSAVGKDLIYGILVDPRQVFPILLFGNDVVYPRVGVGTGIEIHGYSFSGFQPCIHVIHIMHIFDLKLLLVVLL